MLCKKKQDVKDKLGEKNKIIIKKKNTRFIGEIECGIYTCACVHIIQISWYTYILHDEIGIFWYLIKNYKKRRGNRRSWGLILTVGH